MQFKLKRREFIALLGGAAATWPLAAQAEQDDWTQALLVRITRMKAEKVADKIGQFIYESQSQIGWTNQLPWSAGSIEQRRFDALRLLRQVPAIRELAQLDATGKERLRVSRLAMDVVASEADLSNDPTFAEAMAKRVYYGPVYLFNGVMPYMKLSMAGTRRDAGVSVADLSLKLVWDLVHLSKVGAHGTAYILDHGDQVIAHSAFETYGRNAEGRATVALDLSMFPRDFSSLAHVQTARAESSGGARSSNAVVVRGSDGPELLKSYAAIKPLGWLVFVEVPVAEAIAAFAGRD
jgi:two-component system NtrC family sensor kinase